jgi:hypothetical protein
MEGLLVFGWAVNPARQCPPPDFRFHLPEIIGGNVPEKCEQAASTPARHALSVSETANRIKSF